MNYEFIKTLKLVDTGRLRSPKKQNPDGMTVRIYSNGDVYPSQELVNKFNLEYRNKPAEGETSDEGFGMDVIDSAEWAATLDIPRVIFLSVVSRKEPKVDLFAATRYNDDKTPKKSVMSQGTPSETLLELVRSLGYLNADQKYCDLQLNVDHPITPQNGITHIPKVIAKGDRKGEKTVERRENVSFYHAAPPEEQVATPTVSVVANETPN